MSKIRAPGIMKNPWKPLFYADNSSNNRKILHKQGFVHTLKRNIVPFF